MSENKFWLSLWLGLASLVTVIVIAALIYNAHENNIVGDLIAKGHDPLAVVSAFDPVDKDALIINELINNNK